MGSIARHVTGRNCPFCQLSGVIQSGLTSRLTKHERAKGLIVDPELGVVTFDVKNSQILCARI